MSIPACFLRPLVVLLVAAFGNLSVALPSGAALVTTDRVVDAQESESARAKLRAFLARADVAHELRRQGISPDEAGQRALSLTDAEVASVVSRIDRIPAGGGTTTLVIVSILIIFFVLLLTDILGYTDVYPFTVPREERARDQRRF